MTAAAPSGVVRDRPAFKSPHRTNGPNDGPGNRPSVPRLILAELQKQHHQSQLGVDGRDVTHAGSIGPHTAGSTSPRPGGLSLDDRVVFVTDSVRMSR